MTEISRLSLMVGDGSKAREIAIEQRDGAAPGLFWLGGFRSDMTGTKAMALDNLGATDGLMVTRFDYSGHGRSGGDFLDGTISRWLEESLSVFGLTKGPQIVVGSSMGGWLAILLAQAVNRASPGRVKALILIAPAIDMTRDLIPQTLTPALLDELARTGVAHRPSVYSEAPYPITAKLLDDGKKHLLFGRGISVGCPVTILQGGRDDAVPPAHAIKLVQHLLTDPVTLTIVPDGDHRLSGPQEIGLLEDAIRRAAAG